MKSHQELAEKMVLMSFEHVIYATGCSETPDAARSSLLQVRTRGSLVLLGSLWK